jgi:hypothetical protein
MVHFTLTHFSSILKGAIPTRAHKVPSSSKYSRSIVSCGGFQCSWNRGGLGRADPSWGGSCLSRLGTLFDRVVEVRCTLERYGTTILLYPRLFALVNRSRATGCQVTVKNPLLLQPKSHTSCWLWMGCHAHLSDHRLSSTIQVVKGWKPCRNVLFRKSS